jgi:hypothetical protein
VPQKLFELRRVQTILRELLGVRLLVGEARLDLAHLRGELLIGRCDLARERLLVEKLLIDELVEDRLADFRVLLWRSLLLGRGRDALDREVELAARDLGAVHLGDDLLGRT